MAAETPGPRQIGPYRVVRLLGEGGAGRVYEVTREGVAAPLALKQMNGDVADPPALERFLREASLLGRIRHPNVVRVVELGRSDEGPYLVTERVDGEDLWAVLARGSLAAPRARAILQTLCGAVAAVHACGILHRDLKPENVLLRRDGSPVLLDFGLAREGGAEQLTRTGTILGTPAYMAPEQARAISPRELDARVDVYGLGALLFTLLAGRPPFAGRTLIELLTRVLREEPSWSWLERPDVPTALVAICRVAMAKARDARYASAEELGADLARLGSGVPVRANPRLAPPAPAAERAPRRRRPEVPPPRPDAAPTLDLPPDRLPPDRRGP